MSKVFCYARSSTVEWRLKHPIDWTYCEVSNAVRIRRRITPTKSEDPYPSKVVDFRLKERVTLKFSGRVSLARSLARPRDYQQLFQPGRSH